MRIVKRHISRDIEADGQGTGKSWDEQEKERDSDACGPDGAGSLLAGDEAAGS
jgi:hypothetical protein